MSVALESLQQLRHGRGVLRDTPVSQSEHDFAMTIQQVKLREYSSFAWSRCQFCVVEEEEMMESEDMAMMQDESTSMEEHGTGNALATSSVSNKRSATVTPSPDECREQCEACHALVGAGMALYGACVHHQTGCDGGRAAKRTRHAHNDVDMLLD